MSYRQGLHNNLKFKLILELGMKINSSRTNLCSKKTEQGTAGKLPEIIP